LCETNEIPLVFVYSPEYIEAQELTKNRELILAKVAAIAHAHGFELWDFSNSAMCRDKANFYNSQHLNSQGADLFSSELSQRLLHYLKTRNFPGQNPPKG
jgi:hypothetical protein